jgi:hypothetical protein
MQPITKTGLLCDAAMFLAATICLLFALGLAETEKKAEASAYHQKLLDLHIASVTTKHKVTCNDDIIEGWCAKYNMNKVDFEKGVK